MLPTSLVRGTAVALTVAVATGAAQRSKADVAPAASTEPAASAAPPTSEASAPPSEPAPDPEQPRRASVDRERVHVELRGGDFVLERFEGESDVRIVVFGGTGPLQRWGTEEAWRVVCAAPCDRAVPAGEYRITGRGVRTSGTFNLTPGRATIDAHLGSETTRWVGVVGTGLGAGLVVLSLAFAALAGDDYDTSGSSSGVTSPFTLWTVGIGVAIAAVGVGCLFASSNSVTVNGAEAASASPSVPLGGGFALGPRGLEF